MQVQINDFCNKLELISDNFETVVNTMFTFHRGECKGKQLSYKIIVDGNQSSPLFVTINVTDGLKISKFDANDEIKSVSNKFFFIIAGIL